MRKTVTSRYAENRTRHCRSGFSLIEVALFGSILAIAVIGTSGYRYFSALSITKSEKEMVAAQTAQLVIESWRGVKGVVTYNPVNDAGLGLNIDYVANGQSPAPPLDFLVIGRYRIITQQKTFYMTLSYHTVDAQLRILNSKIGWSISDEAGEEATIDKVYSITALVNR
jgi:hypothetical protein